MRAGPPPRCIATALALLLLCASRPCAAQFVLHRSPQVVVQGTGLQGLLDLLVANVDASRDQIDVGLLKKVPQSQSLGGGPGPRLGLVMELVRLAPGTSFGIYAGHEATPALVEVFPTGSRPGWFATVAFRPDPDRMIVSLLDENAALLGSRVIAGGDTLGVGFYLSGPNGTFYSQDARNPGGRAQALFYTGAPWLDWIIAWEDQSADAASDRDYDDAAVTIEHLSEGPYTTALARTTWGRLKQRFR